MTSQLSDLLQNLKEPVVVKIVKGRLDFYGWRSFGEEQCVTLFPPSKQIMILNSTSYENIERVGQHYEESERADNMSFLCSNITESFNDKHCEAKIYHDIQSVLTDVPRYLRAEEDFFAFIEDDNLCRMHKVTTGQVLELFEIHYDHSTENTDLYENVRLAGGEILRCRTQSGIELMLPNFSKVDLVAIADQNSYTLMEIADRFSFPRNISFSNPDLLSSMKQLRKTTAFVAASETVEEMLFACELGKTNIESFDENLLQCKNVFMSSLTKTDTRNVWVEICTGCIESLHTFHFLYAQKQTTLDNGQPIYCVFGIEQNTSQNNDEVDEDEEGDGEDYEPMHSVEIPEFPPVRRFLRSCENSPAGSQDGSRPASLHSVQSSRSSGSRSSGSRSSAGEDYGGSYVHIHLDHHKEQPIQGNSSSLSDSACTDGASSLDTESAVNKSFDDKEQNEIKSMGVTELCKFLQEFKLNNLAEVCENEMIDGDFLTSLADDDLKNEPFSMKDFDLKKFTKLKSGWRPKL